MNTTPRLAALLLLVVLAPASGAASRDLAGDEYAAMLGHLLAARPDAARATLDSLTAECEGEPFYLIARARLALEDVPVDNLDRSAARAAAAPVLADLAACIEACDAGLAAGGDVERLRLLRGWAWMVRSQTHALGRDFWAAGRDAGRGKDDLEFYLARHPDDPVANGLLGAFLYFTDAVPRLVQFLSKLVFLPTGDRDRGLDMIDRALARPSPKLEDFRILAMNINVFFEGRWETGLAQAEELHRAHPSYARLALAPAVMRLWAPGLADRYAVLAAETDSVTLALESALRDSVTLWTVRTCLAWSERFLAGPAAAEPRFRAVVAADPAQPDWAVPFARGQLAAMAAERDDPREALPDRWLAAIPAAGPDTLAALAERLESRAERSLRAAFHAAECHLRLGQHEAANALYKDVVQRGSDPGLAPYRMVAASRVAELAAAAGRHRSASRWLDRALANVGDEYRAEWLLQGRRRHYAELAEAGLTAPAATVLFRGLPRRGTAPLRGAPPSGD